MWSRPFGFPPFDLHQLTITHGFVNEVAKLGLSLDWILELVYRTENLQETRVFTTKTVAFCRCSIKTVLRLDCCQKVAK